MAKLQFEQPLKLMLPAAHSTSIILAGCGGTGSWLAPAIARVGKILVERFQQDLKIFFVDPDRVEEKNIYRQNFCAAEIGLPKAETLAARYGLAWGIGIDAITTKLEKAAESHNLYAGLTLVVGCVDKTRARREILGMMSRAEIWLDCGNAKNYGQILCGVNQAQAVKNPFSITGFCHTLPLPSVQHPELITPEPEEQGMPLSEGTLSCAEMAMQDSQGLSINQRIAAEAADYLVRILVTKDLMKFASYIDLESGTTQSKYITEKAIKAYGKN